ncbi:sodium-dependent bicarbonate transport family permease [Maribacter stanieri]
MNTPVNLSSSLYLPLAITFPFNITLGMPIYLSIVNWF